MSRIQYHFRKAKKKTLFPERNQCVPNPCKNGGNCYDDEDNYKCTCVRGYTGYNCEGKCVIRIIAVSA